MDESAMLEPCPTCGREPDREKRLAFLAGCLAEHRVYLSFALDRMAVQLGHVWRDDRVYAAVEKRWAEALSDDEILAWLERCHTGQVERRPIIEGALADFDLWTEEPVVRMVQP